MPEAAAVQSDASQPQIMPASSCFLVDSRPDEAQVLLSRLQGTSSDGPAMAGRPVLCSLACPLAGQARTSTQISGTVSAYMAATPATWGAAMEVPWPQV